MASDPFPGADLKELKRMRAIHVSAVSSARARLIEDRCSVESAQVSRSKVRSYERMIERIDAQIASLPA